MISQVNFVPGDTVKVHQRIKETDNKGNEKTRIQIFQGVVLGIKGRGEGRSFMVRKLVGDVAVERIWPIISPHLEKVEVKAKPKAKPRRAKLYFLRTKIGNK